MIASVSLLASLAGCADDPPGNAEDSGETGHDGPMLRVMIDVSDSQARLDNAGQPVTTLPDGHAAQDPEFLLIAASTAELVPDEWTALGAGSRIFDSPRHEDVHDFGTLPNVTPGSELISVPLSSLEPGSFQYLRMSVAYQRYRVEGRAEFMGTDVVSDIEIASFLDDALWIDDFEIGDQTISVGGVKNQGYFAAWSQYTGVVQGQVPAGQTTVPNPLDATSPIPVGSCVVAGQFDTPLQITGNETEDVVVHITMSSNQSFEWSDLNDDGKWQPYEEPVVDMGLRGMVLSVD